MHGRCVQGWLGMCFLGPSGVFVVALLPGVNLYPSSSSLFSPSSVFFCPALVCFCPRVCRSSSFSRCLWPVALFLSFCSLSRVFSRVFGWPGLSSLFLLFSSFLWFLLLWCVLSLRSLSFFFPGFQPRFSVGHGCLVCFSLSLSLSISLCPSRCPWCPWGPW